MRYLLLGQTFVESVFSFSTGSIALLIVLILMCGKRVGEADRMDVVTFCVFMLATWAGLVGYSLIAPLGAHAAMGARLRHVMDQLLLQLWPSVLFFCFLICNLPRRPHEFQLADKETV
jgi:cadmium resistance protein CadD (predicted permease)